MDLAGGELRHAGDLRRPGRGEDLWVGVSQGFGQQMDRDRVLLHGPDEPDPALDAAIGEEKAAVADLHRGAAGLAVDEEVKWPPDLGPGAKLKLWERFPS